MLTSVTDVDVMLLTAAVLKPGVDFVVIPSGDVGLEEAVPGVVTLAAVEILVDDDVGEEIADRLLVSGVAGVRSEVAIFVADDDVTLAITKDLDEVIIKPGVDFLVIRSGSVELEEAIPGVVALVVVGLLVDGTLTVGEDGTVDEDVERIAWV